MKNKLQWLLEQVQMDNFGELVAAIAQNSLFLLSQGLSTEQIDALTGELVKYITRQLNESSSSGASAESALPKVKEKTLMEMLENSSDIKNDGLCRKVIELLADQRIVTANQLMQQLKKNPRYLINLPRIGEATSHKIIGLVLRDVYSADQESFEIYDSPNPQNPRLKVPVGVSRAVGSGIVGAIVLIVGLAWLRPATGANTNGISEKPKPSEKSLPASVLTRNSGAKIRGSQLFNGIVDGGAVSTGGGGAINGDGNVNTGTGDVVGGNKFGNTGNQNNAAGSQYNGNGGKNQGVIRNEGGGPQNISFGIQQIHVVPPKTTSTNGLDPEKSRLSPDDRSRLTGAIGRALEFLTKNRGFEPQVTDRRGAEGMAVTPPVSAKLIQDLGITSQALKILYQQDPSMTDIDVYYVLMCQELLHLLTTGAAGETLTNEYAADLFRLLMERKAVVDKMVADLKQAAIIFVSHGNQYRFQEKFVDAANEYKRYNDLTDNTDADIIQLEVTTRLSAGHKFRAKGEFKDADLQYERVRILVSSIPAPPSDQATSWFDFVSGTDPKGFPRNFFPHLIRRLPEGNYHAKVHPDHSLTLFSDRAAFALYQTTIPFSNAMTRMLLGSKVHKRNDPLAKEALLHFKVRADRIPESPNYRKWIESGPPQEMKPGTVAIRHEYFTNCPIHVILLFHRIPKPFVLKYSWDPSAPAGEFYTYVERLPPGLNEALRGDITVYCVTVIGNQGKAHQDYDVVVDYAQHIEKLFGPTLREDIGLPIAIGLQVTSDVGEGGNETAPGKPVNQVSEATVKLLELVPRRELKTLVSETRQLELGGEGVSVQIDRK